MAVGTLPRPAQASSHQLVREIRGVATVWRREMIRFFRERIRAVTSFVQPLLYLLVFGTGLGAAIRGSAVGNYRQFLLPGVIIMTTLFTSMFAAVSIVWDREFGFLKEILVAPVSRTSVVLGKAAGGASTSALQGFAIIVLAPAVGLGLSPVRVVAVAPVLLVFALTVNGLGLMFASRVATMQGFMVVMNFITLPLYFLSGALFPLGPGTPTWLRSLSYVDPATYAVDAIRRTLSPSYPFPLHWGSWQVPIALDVALLAASAALLLAVAIRGFDRQP